MKFCATWYQCKQVISFWGDHGNMIGRLHDGVKNRFTIVKDGKTITLVPLTPKQVYDDQIKLKSEHEAMGRGVRNKGR